MKHAVIITLGIAFVFFFNIDVFAQSINYDNIDFSSAIAKAKEENKLIFVQLLSDCEECNEIADRGLSGEETVEIFENFICLKMEKNSDGYEKITRLYRISPHYPSSLFLNKNGEFLEMMYDKSTSRSSDYIVLAAKAMTNQMNPPLENYNKKYNKGNRSPEFLKEYILALDDLNFDIDTLVSEYADQLSIKSFYTEKEMVFLIGISPVINSRIYNLIHLDETFYSKVFLSLPLDKRRRINHNIIRKSKEKAISANDLKYMNTVAGFARKTYDDFIVGNRVSLNHMLDFYKETKNINGYIRSAKQYYQFHLEKLDVDSIANIEKHDFVELKDGARQTGENLYKIGNQINKMAWTVYELSDDLEYLAMALKWSMRTLVYESPSYHDTYAHISYKLGAKEKAIEWQQKAVDISNERGSYSGNLIAELNKMKDNQL